MTLEAWVEIAWSELLTPPPMADHGKYVTTIFELFWNGNAPVEMKDAKGEVTGAKSIPKKSLDDLEAMFAEAKKLRGETGG